MALAHSPLQGRNVSRFLSLAVLLTLSSSVGADTLAVSAKVDKTVVDLGNPMNLTITINGDTAKVQIPAPSFPEGFEIIGRSQSTNFSIRGSSIERSMGLNFVLLPQRPGTFQLGPFKIQRDKTVFQTEPIEITVKKSVLPPKLQGSGGRFTI